MNKCRVLFGLLLLCAASLYAGGKKEKPVEAVETVVQIAGIVRLVGSGPLPEIVISGESEWYVARDDMDKLHELQHCTVTVEGVETVRELKFANGLPAGKRRELKNIKIIAIQ
ncbi:MAG: hypothetical protein LBH44_01965 [Treponema sp.]|jgi:hypothetical protein|nr:hypothetical protein [Treponema sp.]